MFLTKFAAFPAKFTISLARQILLTVYAGTTKNTVKLGRIYMKENYSLRVRAGGGEEIRHCRREMLANSHRVRSSLSAVGEEINLV